MWRHDAGRTASSPEELPSELHPQWIRQYSQREPVWDDALNQDLMPLDRVFVADRAGRYPVHGFQRQRQGRGPGHTHRGAEVGLLCRRAGPAWHWPEGATASTSPATTAISIALPQTTGALRWKFRGGPTDRKILGNKRLISTWPARGGAVLYGDLRVFRSQHMAVHGYFHLLPGRGDRLGHLAQRRHRRGLPESTAQFSRFRRGCAPRRDGGRCRPAVHTRRAIRASLLRPPHREAPSTITWPHTTRPAAPSWRPTSAASLITTGIAKRTCTMRRPARSWRRRPASTRFWPETPTTRPATRSASSMRRIPPSLNSR